MYEREKEKVLIELEKENDWLCIVLTSFSRIFPLYEEKEIMAWRWADEEKYESQQVNTSWHFRSGQCRVMPKAPKRPIFIMLLMRLTVSYLDLKDAQKLKFGVKEIGILTQLLFYGIKI